MNILPREKQIEVIAALCDGLGIRATARITGVNRETVGTLALRVGFTIGLIRPVPSSSQETAVSEASLPVKASIAISTEAPEALLVKIDLHGYRPRDLTGKPMEGIVQQAWQMGAARLRFVHGHGRTRGKSPGFYNTRTGRLGLFIRRTLRNNPVLRQWIKYSTVECTQWGVTTVGLKANPHPTRSALDLTVLPRPRHPEQTRAVDERAS